MRSSSWRPAALVDRWRDYRDEHPVVARVETELRSVLPPLNFITLHYAYFIATTLITSLIFWGASTPRYSIGYIDSLFLTVSAMTEAGLNTVNLSQMNTFQQVLLFFLIMIGGAIWVSIWTVLARKHVFEKRFQDIVKEERRRVAAATGGVPFVRRVLTLRRSFGEGRQAPVGMGTKMVERGEESSPDPRELEQKRRAGDEEEGRPVSCPGDVDGALARARVPEGSSADADEPSAEMSARGNMGEKVEGANRFPEQATENELHAAVVPNEHVSFSNQQALKSKGRATSVYQRNGENVTRRPLRRADNAPDAAAPALNAASSSASEATPHFREFLTRHNSGRNGQFYDLSSEDRKRLGGCEYRALKLLAVVVPLYFFAWQLLGAVALGAWIRTYMPETATSNGINPFWAGVFFAVSAFGNSGMSLLDANVVPFQQAYFVLIVMGLLILAGNTAYPIFLRLTFWSWLKALRLLTRDEVMCDFKATLEFILNYPRRVYTNLFPSHPTWWLLFMLFFLNGTDWVCFEVLNIGNPMIEAIPTNARVIDGLFQALAVRSGGFYVISISQAYIGLQLLYVVMMYISVYPVVITMRHSNVYEERSLGIYADEAEEDADPEEGRAGQQQAPGPEIRRLRRPRAKENFLGHVLKRAVTFHGVGVHHAKPPGSQESGVDFVSKQIHGQLAHDLWLLVLAVLVITVIETGHFNADPVTFSVFNIIFEVVSAYGTVGISVGLPNQAYSFSGAWHGASKLVLCLVMLRGRHRGLPVALDRAVRLPGEHLFRDEDEDFRIRRTMTQSRRMSAEG